LLRRITTSEQLFLFRAHHPDCSNAHLPVSRRGPTAFDRVLGLNGISTKAIIVIVLIGTTFERVDMFVDISTGYAILNLVGALAITKFLEERGEDKE